MIGERDVDGPVLRIGKASAMEDYDDHNVDALKGLGEDAYLVHVSSKGIHLFGNRPRATAYAVYDFLNRLGFRFFEPTDYGDVIPSLSFLQIPACSHVEKPDKPFREVDLDLSHWDGIDWEYRIIHWALKNRLNVVGISPFHELRRSRLIHCFPALVSEVKRLDLNLCVGGHGIAMFLALPEKYADIGTQPLDEDAFLVAMNENKAIRPHFYGTRGTNPAPFTGTSCEPYPCLSQSDVIEQMERMALALFERFPAIDILRLANNDASAGCDCTQCLSNETQHRTTLGFAQQMELARRLAEAIHRRFPGKRLAHTLQGNACLDYDRQVRHYDIPSNMILWYGLEHESYADPLAGKAGEGLRGHRNLVARVERLSDACGGRDIVIKEMHGSGLYSYAYCAAPYVIAANQSYFRQVSPRYIGGHIFVNPSQHWPLWTLNFLAHYGLLWNHRFDIDAMVIDYAEKYFGPAAAIMSQAIEAVEKEGTLVAVALDRACYGYDVINPPYGDWLAILGRAQKSLMSHADAVRRILYSPIPAEYRCRLRDHYAFLAYTVGIAGMLIPLFKAVRCLAQAEFLASPDQAAHLRQHVVEFSKSVQAEWSNVRAEYSVLRSSDVLLGQQCPFTAGKCWKRIKKAEGGNLDAALIRSAWPLE